jgi:hypothetical protein
MSDIVMRGSTRHTVEYVKYPRLDVTSNPYRKKPKYQPNPTAQIGPDKNTELRSSTALSQLNLNTMLNTQCLRSFSTGTISHDHTLSSDRVG